MQKFKVRKYNAEKNKEIVSTQIARSEEEALAEAKREMRNSAGYTFEIISVVKAKPVSKLQDLANRKPGVIPAYGDYEATGWMDG